MSWLLSSPHLMLVGVAVSIVGAVVLELAFRRRPRAPRTLPRGQRRGMAVVSTVSTVLFCMAAVLTVVRDDTRIATGTAFFVFFCGCTAVVFAIRWPFDEQLGGDRAPGDRRPGLPVFCAKAELLSERRLDAGPVQHLALNLGGGQTFRGQNLQLEPVVLARLQVAHGAYQHAAPDQKLRFGRLQARTIPSKLRPVA